MNRRKLGVDFRQSCGGHVVLTALKKAEDGDLIEDLGGPLAVQSTIVTVHTKPYEIKTIMVHLLKNGVVNTSATTPQKKL